MSALLITTIYFLFPAYIANMLPVIANRLDVLHPLARPIDGGFKFYGEYLFGSSKTWRGLVIGVLGSMFIAIIQFFLFPLQIVAPYSFVDFGAIDPLTFGFAGGVGALGGDLIKSFFKRRFGIKSGQPWPVFDQLDFIIGYFAATVLLIGFRSDIFIAALIVTLILHPMTNLFAYLLRIKKVWW